MIKKLTSIICLIGLDIVAGGCCSTPQVAPAQPVQRIVVQRANVRDNVVKVAAIQKVRDDRKERKNRKKQNKPMQRTGAPKKQELPSIAQAQSILENLSRKYNLRLDLIKKEQRYSNRDWNKDHATLQKPIYQDKALNGLREQVIKLMAEVSTLDGQRKVREMSKRDRAIRESEQQRGKKA